MTTITWLADVLRASGLTVIEHPGWKTRMADGSWEPRFGVVHATAAPKTQSDETQVRIVRDGREGLPGPIANACVDRQGRWQVLAAGRCNTTLVGTAGPYAGYGNRYALGVEACNDNVSEPWPDVQYEAYYRGWAAICKRLGWTASNLVGHKEHTPGHKTDPTFHMGTFRTRVASVLAGDDMPLTNEDAKLVAKWVLGREPGVVRDEVWGRSLSGSIDALIVYGQGAASADKLAEVLAAINADPGNTINLPPEQVNELALLLAAQLPTSETIAEAVADESAARLAD